MSWRDLQYGTAIMTAVKNRVEPMRYSLASWLDCPAVSQIVIIDWGSDVPLIDSLKELDIPGYPDPRITIVRVEAQHWNLCKAYNLALFYHVNRRVVIKLDADVVIVNEQIFNVDPGMLQVSHWSNSTKLNRNYLTGSYVTLTNHLWEVGGYDQRLGKSYGYDDDNLYERLAELGVHRCELPTGYLYHLPHTDKKRFENHENKEYSAEDKWIMGNQLPTWTKQDSISIKYTHKAIDSQYFQATEVNK